MRRRNALAVTVLLALGAAAGTWAVSSTHALRARATKPEVASRQAIARRERQLDAWQASLARALRARPPALPPIPRYAPAALLHPAPSAPLPVFQPPPRTRAVVRAASPPAAQTPVRIAETTQPPPTSPAPRRGAPAGAQSPEQQCEALKQAADGRGEEAQQAAERQCRRLLGDGGGDDGR